MTKQTKLQLKLIGLVYLAALAVVLFPLLWNAQYNVPSADDWSYGATAYQAIQAGAGPGEVLAITFQTVGRNYVNWEGRFVNSFLASLQPGIWGEQYYTLVGWWMLGSLVLGEILFWRMLCSGFGDKEGRLLLLPVAVPTLLLQILYTPNTVESFYWYTGAVNYTFVFVVSLLFGAQFVRIAQAENGIWSDKLSGRMSGKRPGKMRGRAVAYRVLAIIGAVIVGGDNYSTSLSVFAGMLAFYAWQFLTGVRGKTLRERVRALWTVVRRTWYLFALEAGSLLLCILAPGNLQRMDRNFGGAVQGGPLQAIVLSVVRSATNLYSWMNWKLFLMLCLIAPFAWLAMKRSGWRFRYPVWFTLLSFLVYASQSTATLLVDGTTGGGRAAAVLYYSLHIWLVLNLCYWLGFWERRLGERMNGAAQGFLRVPVVYCGVLGIALAALLLCGNRMELSSYRAYRDYRQGWAEQYAVEWNERFAVLHDESVQEVVFAPLSVYPETFLYTDLQDAHGYTWVNNACARYYGKDKITVTEAE
ncbi:MAG: hypothetical protein IJ747_01165 [Lachnospiraceae bacterium]|nr:hypothetical protein [Lachnospiraceae bacterium]